MPSQVIWEQSVQLKSITFVLSFSNIDAVEHLIHIVVQFFSKFCSEFQEGWKS